MSLPTAEQIRAVGLKGVAGTALDSKIDTLIAAFDRLAALWCLLPRTPDGCTMEATAYTLYNSVVDMQDRALLRVPIHNVVSWDEIALDTTADYTYPVTLAPSDIVFEYPHPWILLRPTAAYAWPTTRRGTRITVTAGWDVGADPVLVTACAMQIAQWWASPGGTPPGVQSASMGGTSVTFAQSRSALAPEVRELLWPYVCRAREGL